MKVMVPIYLKINLPIKRQLGVTLISLLVGMVISLLTIMACFTMFKDLIRVAAEAKVDSAQDGSLAAAILQIQMELQNTGYGMDRTVSSGAKDIVVSADNRSVSWRYNASGVYLCQQFSSSVVSGVYSLTLSKASTASCLKDAILADLTYDNPKPLVDVQFYNSNETGGVPTDPYLIQFSLNDAGALCSPFGSASNASSSSSSGSASSSSGAAVATPNKHPLLTITRQNSINSNGNNTLPQSVQYICIANIPRA